MAKKKRKLKNRNPLARELEDPKYQQRIIRDKRRQRRQEKEQWIEDFDDSSG